MNRIDVMAKILPILNFFRKVAVKVSGSKRCNEMYYAWIRTVLIKNVNLNPLSYRNSIDVTEQQKWKVWVMWWQGEESAPKIVQANIARLRVVFGEKNVVLITQDNYQQYVELKPIIHNKFLKNTISITHLSDIIRFNLLNDYGGLWVDATVAISENYKLPENVGFITLVPRGGGYDSFIGNGMWTGWFMGGDKGFPLFSYMVDFFNEYWDKNDKLFDYFLIDDAISVFAESRSDFQNIQNGLMAERDFYYLQNNLTQEGDEDEFINRWQKDERYMIQKLTYKININPEMKPRTLMHRLERI